MHTKTLGTIGEMKAIAKLLELGYEVFLPINENSSIDLIIRKDELILKVQVKSCTSIIKNTMRFSLEKNRSNTKENLSLIYTEDDIDLFILYCHENEYIGSVSIIDAPSKQINVKLEDDGYRNQYKVWLAEDLKL